MERAQYLLVAGLFAVLFLIGGRLGLGLFHEDIENGIQEAQAEIRTLQWAFTGTELRVTDLQTATNKTDDLTNWTAPNDTPIVINATLPDDTVTAYDPAIIQLSLYNTGETPASLWGGIFLPFGSPSAEREDGKGFLLWSDIYEDELGRELHGNRIFIVPAVGKSDLLAAGEVITRNYTIEPRTPTVRAGNYTATGDLDVLISTSGTDIADIDRPFDINGTEHQLRYELSFRLTATD